MIQGNHVAFAVKLLLEEYKINKKYVKGIENAGASLNILPQFGIAHSERKTKMTLRGHRKLPWGKDSEHIKRLHC